MAALKILTLLEHERKEITMNKAAMVVAAVTLIGATAVTAPAEARGRGFGPAIGFGILAGALAAGAYGAYGPYGPRYYGPGYYGGPVYYYGPRYYSGGPYAYYRSPYRHRWHHRHYRHW
jgi:hypothetical protein